MVTMARIVTELKPMLDGTMEIGTRVPVVTGILTPENVNDFTRDGKII